MPRPAAAFFVSSSSYAAAWQSTSLGVTAAAMGEDVTFVFGFDALSALAGGTFGRPVSESERATAARGAQIGAAEPSAMLQDARALGARLLACDTTVRLCGLTPSELEGGVLDEVLGLPEIWRRTQNARAFTFG